MNKLIVNRFQNRGVQLRQASCSPWATPAEMQEERGGALTPSVKTCTPSALGLSSDPLPDAAFSGFPSPLVLAPLDALIRSVLLLLRLGDWEPMSVTVILLI